MKNKCPHCKLSIRSWIKTPEAFQCPECREFFDRLYIEGNKIMTIERKEKERFMLIQDESCHWYVIPVSKEKEFNKLAEDEDLDCFPDWAEPVGGSYTLVTFSEFKIA